MVPVLSMFLTCSYPFPEALAPSVIGREMRVPTQAEPLRVMKWHRNTVSLPFPWGPWTRGEGPKLGFRVSIESSQNMVGVTGVSLVAKM